MSEQFGVAITYRASDGVKDPVVDGEWLLEPRPERTVIVGWHADRDAADASADTLRGWAAETIRDAERVFVVADLGPTS